MQKNVIIGLSIIVVILILFVGYLMFPGEELVKYQTVEPNFEVAAVTDNICSVHNDCETPAEYLIRSNCPYESRCIDGTCVVVCPDIEERNVEQPAVEPAETESKDYFQNLKSAVDSARSLNEKSYTLDYSYKELSRLPDEVLVKVNTRVLNLSHNNITSLPFEINVLKSLEEFYIEHNQLTGALVAEIRHMQNLRVLDASDNQLTGIPAEIGQLKKLQAIDFSNNQMDTMPNEIANIADNLEVLNLSGNRYSQDQINDIQAKIPKTKIIY